MTKFFDGNYATIEELKKAYKVLCLKHHPDLGGSNENMKQVNAEYEKLFNAIKSGLSEDELKKNYHNLHDGYREVLDNIITLPLVIELVGSWLWISGKTYEHAEALRQAGFKFSKSKKMWFWYSGVDKNKKFRSSKKSMDEIRNTYGYSRIDASIKLLA